MYNCEGIYAIYKFGPFFSAAATANSCWYWLKYDSLANSWCTIWVIHCTYYQYGVFASS